MSSTSDSDNIRQEQARLDAKKAHHEALRKEKEEEARKAAEVKEKAEVEAHRKAEEAEVHKKAEEVWIRDNEKKRRDLKKAKLEAMSES